MSFLRLNCFFICILVFFSSYAEKNQNTDSNIATIENKIVAVSGAELVISESSVSKTTTWFTGFINRIDLEQRKINLINDLCREVGADVLVNPQFTYTKRIFGGGKLTVRGYPAKYTNFKPLSDDEIDSLLLNPKFDSNKVIFINND